MAELLSREPPTRALRAASTRNTSEVELASQSPNLLTLVSSCTWYVHVQLAIVLECYGETSGTCRWKFTRLQVGLHGGIGIHGTFSGCYWRAFRRRISGFCRSRLFC